MKSQSDDIRWIKSPECGMIRKNNKGSYKHMKRFFKSLLISFCTGLPLAVILIVFLYANKEDTAFEPVEVDFSKETTITEDVVQDSTITEITESIQETSAELPEETSQSSVIFSFAGDVHFSEQYIAAYQKSGISAFADEEMRMLMQNADLFMLNNEFVFSQRGEAMADKQYTLRNDPKYVSILQELGTDAVSIANNHVLDFGQTAFLDTLDTLEQAGIKYAGGGRNMEEASAPVSLTIHGQTFAIFAATRVSPSYDWYAASNKPGIWQTYDATSLNAAILEAESQYDHTIVFVHWGIERNEMPEEYQRTLAKGYIDSGADLVIGCHPHVLQGFEYYNGVPIVYSLGNYLFGNRTDATVLLNAEFDTEGNLTLQLIPCQRKNGVLTRIQDPKELFSHLAELSYDVEISEKGILVP